MSSKELEHMVIDGWLIAVITAKDLAELLGVPGDAEEWAREMNVKMGLRYDHDYVVPGTPDDYRITYTITAAMKIIPYYIRREVMRVAKELEVLAFAMVGGKNVT